MYKILVVDDEFNIRDGIINVIPWEKIGAEVVGEALDGQDALEKVELLSPDIVITDVYMDNMNGLELSEILRQKHPLVKVIILSGYDDFEFVKRALELKVFTYVIKPVFPKELIEIVSSVIAEMEREKQFATKVRIMESEINRNKSILLERFLYDIINGNIQNNAEMKMQMDFLDIRFHKKYYSCILVTIPEHCDSIKESDIKKVHSLMFSIRETFFNTMDEFEIWPLNGEYGKLTLLAGNDSTDEDEYISRTTKKLEQAIDNVMKILGISVIITVGGVYSDLTDLSRSFMEANLALEYNPITCKSNIILMRNAASPNDVLYINPVEKENMLLQKKASDVKSVIKKANEFLNESYIDTDLTLAAISDHVFLNPSYFSRLYKKETGESFVEALTRIRLNKAKTLLVESNKKIIDISKSVGYSDNQYFCRIFKKYFGYTPIEFRELNADKMKIRQVN